MQPGLRARTRRRRPPVTIVDSVAPTIPAEESFILETEPEAATTILESTGVVLEEDAQPAIIESASTIIEEATQPLSSLSPTSGERTDFYFPPLPRMDQTVESDEPEPRRSKRGARRKQSNQSAAAFLGVFLAVLRVAWRVLRWLARMVARGFKLLILPVLQKIWHWIVDDPYAPPRTSHKRSLLQGRVLGVYQYHLYQRILLVVLGSIPMALALLYAASELINGIRSNFDSQLFLVQDLAGAGAGFFGCLMLIRLATTRITLRSDGIEYKTLFRVVRSRWEEIGVLKVEYFRRSERWVVGTGRGAWAFLFRSLLGLPKGRQLAKLITIYARLGPTGTPYWLPMAGRFTEADWRARTPVTITEEEKQEAPH